MAYEYLGAGNFSVLLQQFFVQRLMQQHQASLNTVSAYRDTFSPRYICRSVSSWKTSQRTYDGSILLSYAVLDFLHYLEEERYNSVRSRTHDLRRSGGSWSTCPFQEPSALATAQSVLAIPMKRFRQSLIGFLSREHMAAILDAPDRNTGRDSGLVMLATLYNTGARVSELIGMRLEDRCLARALPAHSRQKDASNGRHPCGLDGRAA